MQDMLFKTGFSNSAFLKTLQTHNKAPHIVKRNAANIKISGVDAELILKALYPIFTIGNNEPQRAITPGQAVVLYDGDLVIGGGTITEVLA